MKFQTDWATVEYKSDQETKDALFDAVIAFFKEHQSFTGESIMQSDGPQIDAPVLLSNLADDILKFEVTYNDVESN